MIDIRPFRAVRPTRDKAYLVATRSYVSYNSPQHADKLRNNPFTFLHIVDPAEGRDLPAGIEKYELVRNKFEEFEKQDIFTRDQKPTYYLYRQIKDGNEYLGIIAAVSVRDYEENRIKKHEHTITSRENMFTDYLECVGFNAEPVLLTHQDDFKLTQIYAQYLDERSEYEFTSTDRVLHQLWLIEDENHTRAITEAFEEQEALYIADGHHRTASSALLAKRMEEKGRSGDAHNYFMAFLIGEEQMKVYDYNRLITEVADDQNAGLLEKLKAKFWVEEKDEPYKPEKLHEMGMYLDGQWYKLSPKTGTFDPGHPVKHLDAQILNDLVLKPILDIHDLKADERVQFLPGTHGIQELQLKVDEGTYDLAFALHPVTVEQIKRVADAGEIMPPKSTYVEPKMRSGLIIYEF